MEDPFGPSYPQSAIKYLPYRVFIVILAAILITVGKSTLPTDGVKCIEDTFIDGLTSITVFYQHNMWVGLTLRTLHQLLVDFGFLAMLYFWVRVGTSFRFPVCLAAVGLLKVFLNEIFAIRPITPAFTDQLLPSLFFGSNFESTYFFSGIIALIVLSALELNRYGFSKVSKAIWAGAILSAFLTLSMRQNFLMDIVTGGVVGHLSFIIVSKHEATIDTKIHALSVKIFGNPQPEQVVEGSEPVNGAQADLR